ncbi:hypothetical protein HLV35_00250 [Eggerthellaceae bacterium zg-997]|nr:hypothetical protein [Eggerthellaceae bacterium zg-997]
MVAKATGVAGFGQAAEDREAAHVFLVGHPVGHSASPALHAAAYDRLGLSCTYDLADCPAADDARAFIARGRYAALNVTTPHKATALACADRRTVAAYLAGGANLLVRVGNRLVADNVDGLGCVRFLQRQGADVAGAVVAVCGTGPTARAIMHACLMEGAAQVWLVSRSYDRALQTLAGYLDALAAIDRDERVSASGRPQGGLPAGLAPSLELLGTDAFPLTEDTGSEDVIADAFPDDSRATASGPVECAPWVSAPRVTTAQVPTALRASDALRACDYGSGAAVLARADVVVNATTLGMRAGDPPPFDPGLLSHSQTVMDAVYAQGDTALVTGARQRGCAAFGGAGMLVAQAQVGVIAIAAVAGGAQAAGRARVDRGLFAAMARAAGFAQLAEGSPRAT